MTLRGDIPMPSDKPPITDEQLNDLVEGWRDGTEAGYKEIINLKYSTKPKYAAEKLESALPELTAKDMEFARRVIKKLDEWSDQEDVLVLWDIDETIGAEYANYANGGKYEWRFRPVSNDIVAYARENYPQINNGVLTTSSEIGIQRRLSDLYADGFLSSEQTYSLSDPRLTAHDRNSMEDFARQQTGNERYTLSDGETAKLLVLLGLKGKGINVKNIDDGLSADVWKGDGLCVYDLMPSF